MNRGSVYNKEPRRREDAKAFFARQSKPGQENKIKSIFYI